MMFGYRTLSRFFSALAVSALALGIASAASAESHLRALVIGNSEYQNVPEAAASAINAEEMEFALLDLGFDVKTVFDGDVDDLSRTMEAFSLDAAASGPGVVIFIYFAGRAVVEGGQTYLLPVDAGAGPGMASRAILLEQMITLSSAGGGAVYAILDLEKTVPLPSGTLGVGSLPKPPKGLVAAVERQPELVLDNTTDEAFAVVFADETQLPDLRMGPFIDLALAGAQAFSQGQLTISVERGAPSDVVLNSGVDEEISERRLLLRSYDLARTGTDDEKMAFYKLYPDYDRAGELMSDVAETAPAKEVAVELSRPVFFNVPLSGTSRLINGLTMAEVLKLKPKHPPIEGLPRPVWENKTCLDCHKWDQATLCEHGGRYQGEIWDRVSVKLHPLGGSFKRVIRAWAADGCMVQ